MPFLAGRKYCKSSILRRASYQAVQEFADDWRLCTTSPVFRGHLVQERFWFCL